MSSRGEFQSKLEANLTKKKRSIHKTCDVWGKTEGTPWRSKTSLSIFHCQFHTAYM